MGMIPQQPVRLISQSMRINEHCSSSARLWAIGCGLLTLLAPAVGQGLPNAGSLLRDIQAAPSAEGRKETQGSPAVLEAVAPEVPLSAPFEVRRLEIVGNTVFDSDSLHALVAGAEGQWLTLQQIDDAIGAITRRYRDAGYPLSRAIIPAQTIEEGLVRIQVLEATWGSVQFQNQSAVGDTVLVRTVSDLRSGEPITRALLDRAILLVNDLPGVRPQALFRPGRLPGSSDLLVDVQAADSYRADAQLDNFGNDYTGRNRLALRVNSNNLMHLADSMRLSALTTGDGMNHLAAVYELPVATPGLYFGWSASALNYKLGNRAARLGAHGNATQTGAWLRHALVRGARGNFSARLSYDQNRLQDDVDSAAVYNHRTAGLAGLEFHADRLDDWFGGGQNSGSWGLQSGKVAFDNAEASAADALTRNSAGGFTKTSFAFSRAQGLDAANTLLFTFSGQWARKNLDASQKFSLGGVNNVRAYEGGVLSGDTGQFASLELRHSLAPDTTSIGTWGASVFIEAGQVQINQTPWGSGNNQAYISGAGVGLEWHGPTKWHARMHIARALAPAPSQLDGASDTHSSTWLQISRDL